MKAPPQAAQAAAAWTAGLLAATSLPAIFWQEALHQRGSAWPILVAVVAAGSLLLGSYLAASLRGLRLFAAVLDDQAMNCPQRQSPLPFPKQIYRGRDGLSPGTLPTRSI